LAWAKKNKVTPPDYAILSDESSEKANPVDAMNQRSESIYGEEQVDCGSYEKEFAKKSCCKATSSANKSCCSDQKEKLKRERGFVICLLAQKCQGKDFAFAQLPWVVPSQYSDGVLLDGFNVVHFPVCIEVLLSIDQQPDTPPPKLLSV
jgi:hypothetical protein